MEPLIRTTSVPDGLFWLLLVGLGLSVAARYRDPNRWVLFTALAMNNKYLMVFNRGKLWRQPFFWIMNLAFWAQSTAFLWVHWTQLGLGPQAPELWWLFAGVGMGLSVKIGAQKITAELFSNKTVAQLVHGKLSYQNFGGLALFLGAAMGSYFSWSNSLITWVFVVIYALILGVGWFTLVKAHQKYLQRRIFYFILYICAFEIAPWIILWRYLNKGLL